jgi:hypothetical protein
MATNKRPLIKNINDLRIDLIMTPTGPKGTRWYHFTADDKAYMGMSDKDHQDLTLDNYAAGLECIPDDEIFPELPAHPPITLAPRRLNKSTAFVKRAGLSLYHPDPKDKHDAGHEGKDMLLGETLIMEQLA